MNDNRCDIDSHYTVQISMQQRGAGKRSGRQQKEAGKRVIGYLTPCMVAMQFNSTLVIPCNHPFILYGDVSVWIKLITRVLDSLTSNKAMHQSLSCNKGIRKRMMGGKNDESEGEKWRDGRGRLPCIMASGCRISKIRNQV